MWIIQSIQLDSQDNRNFEANRVLEISPKYSTKKTDFNDSEIQPQWQDKEIILFDREKYIFNKNLIIKSLYSHN